MLLPMLGSPVRADLNTAVLGEIVLRGATVYTPGDFRAAADAVNHRALDVRPLLDGEPRPPAHTQAAFEELQLGPESIKILIDPAR